MDPKKLLQHKGINVYVLHPVTYTWEYLNLDIILIIYIYYRQIRLLNIRYWILNIRYWILSTGILYGISNGIVARYMYADMYIRY